MNHKIVAVDESGVFSEVIGSFSGVGAVVADWSEYTRQVAADGVSSLVSAAPAAQLRKGELKGSSLSAEQFSTACDLVKQIGAKVCLFAIREDGNLKNPPKEEFDGMVRAVARLAGVVELGERLRDAAERCGPSDFLYSECVQRLFMHGVVQVVCSGPMPDRITVVFDPKLAPNRRAILEPQVYLAFVDQLKAELGPNPTGFFGLADSPWRVVPAAVDHQPFLTLVDWMIYPFVAVRRLGSRFLNGTVELKDRAEAALEMVNVQKRLGIFKEATIPKRLLAEFGVS